VNEVPGHRVLIVEDDALIGLELESLLKDAGMEVVGPAHSVDAALSSTAAKKLDVAVLDIDLGDETVFPVADALARAHVPFLFLSGHSSNVMPRRHRSRPMLAKPYRASDLLGAVSLLVGGRAS
jgi:DNA-binding response OmpR family regulator